MPREYDILEPLLLQFDPYVKYRNGQLSTEDYQIWFQDRKEQLAKAGLNNAQLRRLPYDFGGFQTSIYPDEEELAYALTHAIKPRSSFYAGSYFGYWAIYMMPAISEVGGSITLSDINPKVSALCAANMERLGYAHSTVCATDDAEKLLLSSSAPLDFVILDATASYDNPDPERRGKGIYGVLAKAALPRLRKGGFVLIHNHEPDEPGLQSMFDLLNSECSKGLHLESYNGLGVYRK